MDFKSFLVPSKGRSNYGDARNVVMSGAASGGGSGSGGTDYSGDIDKLYKNDEELRKDLGNRTDDGQTEGQIETAFGRIKNIRTDVGNKLDPADQSGSLFARVRAVEAHQTGAEEKVEALQRAVMYNSTFYTDALLKDPTKVVSKAENKEALKNLQENYFNSTGAYGLTSLPVFIRKSADAHNTIQAHIVDLTEKDKVVSKVKITFEDEKYKYVYEFNTDGVATEISKEEINLGQEQIGRIDSLRADLGTKDKAESDAFTRIKANETSIGAINTSITNLQERAGVIFYSVGQGYPAKNKSSIILFDKLKKSGEGFDVYMKIDETSGLHPALTNYVDGTIFISFNTIEIEGGVRKAYEYRYHILANGVVEPHSSKIEIHQDTGNLQKDIDGLREDLGVRAEGENNAFFRIGQNEIKIAANKEAADNLRTDLGENEKENTTAFSRIKKNEEDISTLDLTVNGDGTEANPGIIGAWDTLKNDFKTVKDNLGKPTDDGTTPGQVDTAFGKTAQVNAKVDGLRTDVGYPTNTESKADGTVYERINATNSSLGTPVDDNGAKADGTAYERIAWNKRLIGTSEDASTTGTLWGSINGMEEEIYGNEDGSYPGLRKEWEVWSEDNAGEIARLGRTLGKPDNTGENPQDVSAFARIARLESGEGSSTANVEIVENSCFYLNGMGSTDWSSLKNKDTFNNIKKYYVDKGKYVLPVYVRADAGTYDTTVANNIVITGYSDPTKMTVTFEKDSNLYVYDFTPDGEAKKVSETAIHQSLVTIKNDISKLKNDLGTRGENDGDAFTRIAQNETDISSAQGTIGEHTTAIGNLTERTGTLEANLGTKNEGETDAFSMIRGVSALQDTFSKELLGFGQNIEKLKLPIVYIEYKNNDAKKNQETFKILAENIGFGKTMTLYVRKKQGEYAAFTANEVIPEFDTENNLNKVTFTFNDFDTDGKYYEYKYSFIATGEVTFLGKSSITGSSELPPTITLKTINGESLEGTGNIELATEEDIKNYDAIFYEAGAAGIAVEKNKASWIKVKSAIEAAKTIIIGVRKNTVANAATYPATAYSLDINNGVKITYIYSDGGKDYMASYLFFEQGNTRFVGSHEIGGGGEAPIAKESRKMYSIKLKRTTGEGDKYSVINPDPTPGIFEDNSPECFRGLNSMLHVIIENIDNDIYEHPENYRIVTMFMKRGKRKSTSYHINYAKRWRIPMFSEAFNSTSPKPEDCRLTYEQTYTPVTGVENIIWGPADKPSLAQICGLYPKVSKVAKVDHNPDGTKSVTLTDEMRGPINTVSHTFTSTRSKSMRVGFALYKKETEMTTDPSTGELIEVGVGPYGWSRVSNITSFHLFCTSGDRVMFCPDPD